MHRATPFLVAAVLTALVGVAVAFAPYFPGDVALARALQAALPGPGWAQTVSRLPSAPAKYVVMALAVGGAYWFAGWRAALIAAVAIALDHVGSEASKAIFSRPRPSRDLVAVVGASGGFSFPSGTITFLSVTFGWLAIVAARAKPSAARIPVLAASSAVVIVGAAARVWLGAHWPSDVFFTAALCAAWLWAVAEASLPRSAAATSSRR